MKRRTAKSRRGLPRGGILQLACGNDYFSDGFGDDVEAMREAWADPDVQEQVWLEHRRRHKLGKPWASYVFDDGVGDVFRAKDLRWQETNPEDAAKAITWARSRGLMA